MNTKNVYVLVFLKHGISITIKICCSAEMGISDTWYHRPLYYGRLRLQQRNYYRQSELNNVKSS